MSAGTVVRRQLGCYKRKPKREPQDHETCQQIQLGTMSFSDALAIASIEHHVYRIWPFQTKLQAPTCLRVREDRKIQCACNCESMGGSTMLIHSYRPRVEVILCVGRSPSYYKDMSQRCYARSPIATLSSTRVWDVDIARLEPKSVRLDTRKRADC